MIVKSLIKRKERFALTLIGIILVSSAFSIFVTLTENVSIQTHKSLEESWRYPYDILVRPKNSLSFMEKEYNLVQPNFLSNIYSGVTIDQWEKIKDIKGVEVAAPIAILGCFDKWVEIEVDLPEDLYRVEKHYTMNNGYKEYNHSWRAPMLSGIEEILDGRMVGWVYIAEPGFMDNFENYVNGKPHKFYFACGKRSNIIGEQPYSGYTVCYDLDVIMGAIDPDQEKKLHGMENSIVDGVFLDKVEIERDVDTREYIIPFITNITPYCGLSIDLKGYRIDLPSDVNILGLTKEDAESYPEELFIERTLTDTDVTEQFIKDLGIAYFDYAKDYPLFLHTTVRYKYLSSTAFSQKYDVLLEAVPLLTEGELKEAEGMDAEFENIYKSSSLEWERPIKINMAIKNVGLFDINKIPVSTVKDIPVPLYNPPHVVLRYNEEKEEIDPVQLKPTHSQGYITEPPFMLTTIEGAKHIVGDDCISAIRVRVSDIEEINEETFKRIERVAREIVQKTDLHVDIMVGSSPKKVLVHLPDLGYVEELWTQKGVTVEIFRYTKKSNLFIFSISLLVCSLYILNTMLMSTLSRKREIGILKSIGWYNSTVFKMILSESFVIGFIGGIIGIGIAFILSEIFDLILPTSRILIILPLSVSLSLLGGLYPAYKAMRIDPIKAIRFGEIEKRERFGLFMRNILSRKTRSILVLICIAVSISLFTVLLLTSLNLGNVLEGTLLGEKISFKVEKYHFFSVLICFVISSFAIADIFSRNVYERRKEIGILKSIGWYNKDILKIFFYESLFLGFIGGVLGVFSGILAFLIVSQTSFESLIITFFVGVSLSLLVSILSSLYPIRRINKILPSEAIRYE